ncbi:MAG: hypothetical protein R2751_15760 [Bacteroidales bacterium]
MPDPPRGQGIWVFTSLLVGVDFAILRTANKSDRREDPQQGPRPDHINDPSYDPASIDLPGSNCWATGRVFSGDWALPRRAWP